MTVTDSYLAVARTAQVYAYSRVLAVRHVRLAMTNEQQQQQQHKLHQRHHNIADTIIFHSTNYLNSRTSLNRSFMVVPSIGPFREVIDLENIKQMGKYSL